MAAARARGCELLVAGRGGDGGDGFLVGMCSMLDVLLARPIEEVLEHLPIEGEGRAALLGESNTMRHLLDSVIAYERGDWDVCLDRASAAGVDPQALAGAYAQALDFAHELTAGSAGA
jgi:EAL and modified HD-GYP domain-containing signal transduction protein